MKTFAVFVLLSSLLGLGFSLEEKCPKEAIKPCTCRTYFDGACIITCSLVTQEDVQRIADIPNLCEGHVHFVLVHSKISGIPTKLWKVLLSSKTVDITIKHAGLEGLAPPGSDIEIPNTYTSGEAVIKVDHSKVGAWDWKLLSKFYSEEELTIVIDDTPLTEISKDFSLIADGQVHKVTIDSTGLTTLPDKIFASFDDLMSLSLQNNKLKSVSRSLMPKPANRLQFLNFNGNLLETLPDDLLAQMPALEVVYLRNNKLRSLSQELLPSVSSNKLQRIDLVYNPWECDCRLMWILQNSKQHLSMGKCASPDSLAQKKVKDLPTLLDC